MLSLVSLVCYEIGVVAQSESEPLKDDPEDDARYELPLDWISFGIIAGILLLGLIVLCTLLQDKLQEIRLEETQTHAQISLLIT